MNFNPDMISHLFPQWVLVVAGFVFSFMVTWMGVPAVVRVARIKGLYDMPGDRTCHLEPTPRLGGTMIFAGLIISSVLFTGFSNAYELKYIIAGLIVLFFVGLKDDIVALQPYKKAIGQLLAALIIVVPGEIRISSLFGLAGITEIPYLPSVLVSLLLVLFIINSINFIDGIDGLASGIGILVTVILGVWFYFNGQPSYSVMCLSLTGALASFFYFNVFSSRNKIFLGDTGSMIIGFMLAVMVIRFLRLNAFEESPDVFHQAPSLALAFLFVPVFDTLRICIIRLMHGRSIFQGDNNHIHHRVLRLSGSHLKATLVIISANMILIAVTYLMRKLSNPAIMLFLLGMGVLFSIILGIRPKGNSKGQDCSGSE